MFFRELLMSLVMLIKMYLNKFKNFVETNQIKSSLFRQGCHVSSEELVSM